MKFLLTSGCSFSETFNKHTWPTHLADYLSSDYEHVSTAMGSQGNGLISRGVIYQLSQKLKQTTSDNVLLGVMWSGPNRHDFYRSNAEPMFNIDGWMTNPTKFIPKSTGGWVIINPNWKITEAKEFYRHFHDSIGAMISTLEHILRVQWFCKLNNIKYFMTCYTGEVLPKWIKAHPDTGHLYEQIDLDFFLPVTGEYEWCRDFSSYKFPQPGDNHPGLEQHKEFTEKVIIPFLLEKFNIGVNK